MATKKRTQSQVQEIVSAIKSGEESTEKVMLKFGINENQLSYIKKVHGLTDLAERNSRIDKASAYIAESGASIKDAAKKFSVNYSSLYDRQNRSSRVQSPSVHSDDFLPHYLTPLPEINGIFDWETFYLQSGYNKV